MAGGLNKVFLMGNLGRDPEVRYTQGGAAVANFSIATNERWTDKNGQQQEKTEWHKIVVWGKTAELCGQYLKKGRQAFIEGRLQTREWTDKQNAKQYTTEIVATNVQFIGPRPDGVPAGNGAPHGAVDGTFAPPPGAEDTSPPAGVGPDDIPF